MINVFRTERNKSRHFYSFLEFEKSIVKLKSGSGCVFLREIELLNLVFSLIDAIGLEVEEDVKIVLFSSEVVNIVSSGKY